MINLNVNRIEARLKPPAANLITPVNYLVIGGGFGGGKISGGGNGNGGQPGEFITAQIPWQHGTTGTFTVGQGGAGSSENLTGKSYSNIASGSTFDYPAESLSITALPGSGSAIGCPTQSPCDGVGDGGWIETNDGAYLYDRWAQRGGTADPISFEAGIGGGMSGTYPVDPENHFPFVNQRSSGPDNQNMGYNNSGGGGAGGNTAGYPGGNGLVAFAFYDPNEIFDISYVSPSTNLSDNVVQQVVNRTFEGYRIWYFLNTNGTGSFTIHGRKQ